MFHEKEFLSFVFRTISKILHLPCSTDLFQTFLDSLNPFLANAPILYPMKTLENTPPSPRKTWFIRKKGVGIQTWFKITIIWVICGLSIRKGSKGIQKWFENMKVWVISCLSYRDLAVFWSTPFRRSYSALSCSTGYLTWKTIGNSLESNRGSVGFFCKNSVLAPIT